MDEMALNIKSREAERLAQDLVRLTGETLTDTVTAALREGWSASAWCAALPQRTFVRGSRFFERRSGRSGATQRRRTTTGCSMIP